MLNNRYIIYQLTELFGGCLVTIIGTLVLLNSFSINGTEAEVVTLQLVSLLLIYVGLIKVTPYVDETIIWLYNAISQIIYAWKFNREKNKK
jgi:hypothetical protein